MRYILFLSFIAILLFHTSCKTKPEPKEAPETMDTARIESNWKQVDSLENKGLITSALELVIQIKKDALTHSASNDLIKAVVYENKFQNQLEEDAAIQALLRGEEDVKRFPEPAKSVMHSLLAQWYYNYLQSNVWKLRSVSSHSDSPGDDIRTWGISHLVGKIQSHYTASMQWSGLKVADVKVYEPILTEGSSTDHLRPTLYDILMHRALDFYAGAESFLPAPPYQFTLTSPNAFSDAALFATHTFVTDDSLNHTWQALRWYQQLLLFRLSDESHPSALLEADLQRLRFVYDHIVHEKRDSLYEAALNALARSHASVQDVALVNFYIAQLWMQQAGTWQHTKDPAVRDKYKQAKALCDEMARQYPDAYGTKLCQNLLVQLQQKNLSAVVESVILPDEPFFAQVSFRNIESLSMKIVLLPQAPRRWKGDSWEGEKILSGLNQLPTIKKWEQALGESEDFQPHTQEIDLPALKVGQYALVISDHADFNPGSSTSGALFFTVSELGYWFIDDRKTGSTTAAVIHRKTGAPLAGVLAEFITFEYNAGLRRQVEAKLGESTSDADGWVNVPTVKNQNISIRLTKGNDEFYADEAHYTYMRGGRERNQPLTLFFSDRSIYRPGQKMYFKGYVAQIDKDEMPAIVANQKAEVILRDANGQEVAKQSFISNEYGTFSGHFDLPTGGLTGKMTITSSYGGNTFAFRVEEYKRPKFEVTFDTIQDIVRLNEEVMITSVARDFAGSPVSGAQVGYRVERVSYRPWWYGYRSRFWPPAGEDRQVLKVGQGLTDDKGKSNIQFVAAGKAVNDPDLMYRFEITVYITDITGESHEATKTLTLNAQGYEVTTSIGEQADQNTLKKISIHAFNSEGSPVDISGTVEVLKLVSPKTNKRDRLWDDPDVMQISKIDFEKMYPFYFYPGQSDMAEWDTERKTGSTSLQIKGTGTADLSGLITLPGHYEIKWKWRDASGKELAIDQFVTVIQTGQPLPGQQPLAIHWEESAYKPGQTVTTALLTGLNTIPYVIRIEEHKFSATKKNWIRPSAAKVPAVTIAENDRGGFVATYLSVYNNRFYEQYQNVRVPWSNKELTVELKTWRDKLEPGDDETWTITAVGKEGEKVNAEMLMSMYDASLDAFVPHQWQMSLYPTFYSQLSVEGSEPEDIHYWGLTNSWYQQYEEVMPARVFRDINTFGYYPGYFNSYRNRTSVRNQAMDGVMLMEQSAEEMPSPVTGASKKDADGMDESDAIANDAANAVSQNTMPPLRSALDETVFFFPQMNTDDQGRLTFSFKMKEGLTRWKFQALAHTRQLAFGLMQEEVVTQKKLMVFPNPPRFFRANDTIAFQIKVSNVSDTDMQGESQLKILDAFTREDVSKKWMKESGSKPLQVGKGESVPVHWMLYVPADWTRPVVYQVYANGGAYTDGEESLVPVVTNRILVTETLPLPLKANETKTFVFQSMIDHKSASLDHHQYVVEMTTSPAWYAVQALPYLMEYPHECAEQVFSRLYANLIASHIAKSNPAIEQVYETWRKTDAEALKSPLEKNQDLKSAMLEETPWVRDAMGETQQRRDIALLFDGNRMQMEARQAVDKLSQMQLSNGGFPWFPGGRDNWYITQYLLEGLGHLRKLNVGMKGADVSAIERKAVPYIDSRVIEWYDELKKMEKAGKLNMNDHHIGSMQVHFLYTRSFYPEIKHQAKLDEVINYLATQIEKYWLQHGIYDQGLMALAGFKTWPNTQVSKDILASLRERTIYHEELGRYWKIPNGFYWNESQIELQSLMVELFQDMGVPQAEVDELRVWLLKNKQTTQWKTTRATASAVYALLIHPDAWLSSTGIVEVRVGGKQVIGNTSDAQAGTGYVKKSWDGDDIKDNWSSIEVVNPNSHIAWGSAYWQYWEDLDKVKSSVENNPLKLTKTFLIAKNGVRGEETSTADVNRLKVGDKLIVRITVETDRAMEFVHLKDVRASGLEPFDVLSGYRWAGGLGYYQSTKDLATHFFIDYLPRGKYVMEYAVNVAQAGDYSDGMAQVQCMYAPEFSAHSAGNRLSAK